MHGRQTRSPEFVSMLEHEFERRRARNTGYSLRAFARDLEMGPSHLCEVLRGRYGLSEKAARKISDKMPWTKQESDFFCTLVDSSHARDPKRRKLAAIKLQNKELNISPNEFRLIADWYHFPIVELVSLPGFRGGAEAIARHLELDLDLTKKALERLLSLGLIKKYKRSFRSTTPATSTRTEVPSIAIRDYHRQMISKSIDALDRQPLDDREFSSVVLSFSTSQLAEAKEMIRQFQDNFNHKFGSSSKNKNAVYQLGTQFFKLTKDEINEES